MLVYVCVMSTPPNKQVKKLRRDLSIITDDAIELGLSRDQFVQLAGELYDGLSPKAKSKKGHKDEEK